MKFNNTACEKNVETFQLDLVHQVQLRNTKAFIQLYQAYSPGVCNLIKRVVSCPLATEEIMQNAFLKVWLNIDKYQNKKGSLYTWMVSIARNEAVDYLRSRQAREVCLTVHVHHEELTEIATIESRLDYKDLTKSLQTLPSKDRIILELYSVGFTCKEISKIVCLPEGTVKTRMRMSYRKLRHYLIIAN